MVRNTARQAHHAARSGDNAAFHFRQAEVGAVGRNNQVAGQGNFKTTGQAVAFHSSNQRFGRWTLANTGKAAVAYIRALASLGKGFQIHTGAEGIVGPCQHAYGNAGVGIELIQSLGQRLRGFQVDGIACLGTVQSNQQHLADTFKRDKFTHGPSLL
ncbi:hypothetical protein C660_03128 [Alcaligenes sp. HPC1271]|nr:hypothetical protein C660_03128 [Alcaligenes sp. HPC1271]